MAGIAAFRLGHCYTISPTVINLNMRLMPADTHTIKESQPPSHRPSGSLFLRLRQNIPTLQNTTIHRPLPDGA